MPEDDAVPVDPVAARLCAALYAGPSRTRAVRGGGPAPAPVSAAASAPAADCERRLSLGLARGAVAWAAPALTACLAALEAEAAAAPDCASRGRTRPAPPAPCQHLLIGRLAAGAPCRSSLECAESMQCTGAGPGRTGTCGGPLQLGAPCGAAPDALADVLRQAGAAEAHPVCDGYCARGRCRPLTPVDGACASNAECGSGRACVEGRCGEAPRALPAGARCPGLGCAAGLVCAAGACRAPAPTGSACTEDAECAGVCVRESATDAGGRCGPFCE